MAVGVVLVVVGGGWLVATGSPFGSVVRFLLVWVGLFWWPGVLVWRACAGCSTLEIELGAGAGCGLALVLISWIAATALGLAWLAAVPPAAVLVVCAAHPGWRALYRPQRPPELVTRPGWWLAIGVVAVLAVHRVAVTVLRPSVLPPGPNQIAPDTWYALGIAQQLLNGFPVADPSLAGGEIRYHWFALAIIVAASQLAGVDLSATLIHLWFVPFVVMWVCVIAALVRALALPYTRSRPAVQHPWWGPVAAALVVVVPAALTLGPGAAPGLGNGLNSSSASGAFGGLFVSALALAAVTLLRDPGRRALAVPVGLLIVAGAGTKPTVLLVSAAAACLVAAWLVLTQRRIPWLAAGLAVAPLLAFAIAGRLVIGSTTGTQIQPFSLLSSDRGYPALFAPDAPPGAGAGGFWLPALAEGRPGAVSFVIVVGLLFVLGQTVRLIGVVLLPVGALSRDPAGWWCSGVVISGFAAAYLIGHSGYSQQWFASNVTGVGTALTVATLASLRRPPGWRGVVTASIGGVALGIIAWLVFGAPDLAENRPLLLRVLPYVAPFLVALLVLGGTRWRGGRRAGMAGVGLAAAVLLGASLPANAAWLTRSSIPITGGAAATVSRDQQLAAIWLRDHSGTSDVVVSNVFCRPVSYVTPCNHAGVWVGALTGRELVLDGWAYLPQTMTRYDGSVPGTLMPSPYPDRLRDSLAVVRDGSRAAACRLVERYGADWVYADGDATEISSRLTRFATLAHQEGSVRVYRLDPARLSC